MFIGRRTELGILQERLQHVRDTGTGVAVAVRGRRQVGKSRLVQEVCDRAELPYVYFTAVKGRSSTESAAMFLGELRDSALPVDGEQPPETGSGGWDDTLRLLAGALPDGPSIVVLDELPWLSEQDQTFDATLQVAWDRLLSAKPVLLLLLGSDLHLMQRLTASGRPFHGRADNLVVGPFNPRETATLTGLRGADAVDAYLITGGLPSLALRWPARTPPDVFLLDECADAASPLYSVPEQSLSAEFPVPDVARRILEAVGSGNRTFANIAAGAGGCGGPVRSGTLSPLLRRLVEDKQVLAVAEPLSARAGKPARYRVADSNLRLYLGILRDAHQQVLRGRVAPAAQIVTQRWASWRGSAVEPVVRDALANAAGNGGLPGRQVEAVGGWWNRRFEHQIDLVGADRGPVAGQIGFTGSIKWLETPFDRRDLAALRADAALVPGFDADSTGLVVVSRSGADLPAGEVDMVWAAEDVIAAWA